MSKPIKEKLSPSPLTKYTFVSNEFDETLRRQLELEVPFSLEEIEILREARLFMANLNEQAITSGGWQRELFFLRVPWAYTLVNREQALARIDILWDVSLKIGMFKAQGIKGYMNTSETDIAQRPGEFSKQMIDILDKFYDLLGR